MHHLWTKGGQATKLSVSSTQTDPRGESWIIDESQRSPQSLLNRLTTTKEMKKVGTDRLHDHANEWKVWTKRGGMTKCSSRGYWTWQEKI